MQKTNLLVSMVVVACLFVGTQACRQKPPQPKTPEVVQMPQHDRMEMKERSEPVDKAVCVLQPTQGSKTNGTVTFIRTGSAVRVVADIQGLSPGKHGFHIHEYGDCSSPDGTAAGDHFNPTRQRHGSPSGSNRHAGDLGNLEVGKDGKVHYEMVDSVMTFDGRNSIIGRAVVVHAGADDMTSQPSGNSGPRIAQGVIGIAKE